MIVATRIESLACETDNHNYSQGVRMILGFVDDMTCHASQKFKAFWGSIGIAKTYLPNLLYVFFMEWSVQGFQALGRQTDMNRDRIVFDELLHYEDILNSTNPSIVAGYQIVRASANA